MGSLEAVELYEWRGEHVPGFPTRDSYLTPFEGNNIRPPEVEAAIISIWEDTDEQDRILTSNNLREISMGHYSKEWPKNRGH